MKNVLKVVDFIKNNSDWENILSQKPYCISVTRDEMFGWKMVMLKYNQFDSDFMNPIVRECRGLILEDETFEPISVPFFKFGNVGEPYCPEIDWNNCWVGEKMDGSLIKIVRLGGNILISTNGTIDAFKANIADGLGCTVDNFGDLALLGLLHYDMRSDVLWSMMEENKTYMFELTSPWNRIVVKYPETKLNFLGVRDNITLQETYFTDHPMSKKFDTPKIFPLRNVEECRKAAEVLTENEEGYVVCDKDFNRVKIKSPLYVKIHHIRGEGVMTWKRALDIVRNNEIDEVLTYFPEHKDIMFEMRDRLNCFINGVSEMIDKLILKKNTFADRKEAAMWIKDEFGVLSGVGFLVLDDRLESVKSWVCDLNPDKLLELLGYD